MSLSSNVPAPRYGATAERAARAPRQTPHDPGQPTRPTCAYPGDMRAIWRGTISFGLVSIPVKLYTATEAHDVSFRQVHEADGGRIRYKRVCELDGEEVPYGDIAKGYELPGGEIVVLSDEDFA